MCADGERWCIKTALKRTKINLMSLIDVSKKL